jgi:hypothetical protein
MVRVQSLAQRALATQAAEQGVKTALKLLFGNHKHIG